MILPEIGKTYNFYDDGKITFNRQYKCKIINVIPYDNASNQNNDIQLYNIKNKNT